MDKRDGTEFDLLTVNETSVEPPQDESTSLNAPQNLALEATFINHNFSQQVKNALNITLHYFHFSSSIKIIFRFYEVVLENLGSNFKKPTRSYLKMRKAR